MLKNFYLSGTAKEIIYVSVTFSTYVLIGINRSYPAFLFHQLDSPGSPIPIDDEQKSGIASFISLLSPIGCLLIGFIMDYGGRKISVQCVIVPFLMSWIIIAFANSVEMLYIASLIQSIGAGMSICTASYVSEISTTDHRGPLLGAIGITYNMGILLCNVLMYYMEWYKAAYIFTILSIGSLLLSYILPESPTWLYMKGKKDASIKTLTSLRAIDRNFIEPEIEDLEKYCSTQVKSTLNETMQNCINAWKPLLIVVLLFVLQQNTGYSVMTLYIIMIIDRLHIPYESTGVALLYAITCSVAGFITPYAMHKFGRKTMLAVSAFGMAVCSATVAVHQHIFESQSEKPFVWIVPAALCAYIISASIGVIPIGFTVAGELFPNEVRGVMNGIYGAYCFLYWSFLFKISPWYLNLVGGTGMMWTFSGFAILSALYGLFILPETKGKTLNEVQEEYFKKKS